LAEVKDLGAILDGVFRAFIRLMLDDRLLGTVFVIPLVAPRLLQAMN